MGMTLPSCLSSLQKVALNFVLSEGQGAAIVGARSATQALEMLKLRKAQGERGMILLMEEMLHQLTSWGW